MGRSQRLACGGAMVATLIGFSASIALAGMPSSFLVFCARSFAVFATTFPVAYKLLRWWQ